MIMNKSAGPDEIVTEMLSPLVDFGIDKITKVINELYNAGDILKHLSKSIFVTLPKNPGADECRLN